LQQAEPCHIVTGSFETSIPNLKNMFHLAAVFLQIEFWDAVDTA
jgi:hypothetical protein